MGQWLFAAFMFFTLYSVLNVITGIFCNNAIETTRSDPDLAAASLMHMKEVYIHRLKLLFSSVDQDGSGHITVDEFELLMTEGTLQAYLMTLGLEASDAWEL